MKKFCNFSVILFAFTVSAIISCQKNEMSYLLPLENKSKSQFLQNLEDSSIKGDFEVHQGILHFKNLDSFKKVWNNLELLKSEERVKYWHTHQFKNVSFEFFEMMKKLGEANTKSQFDSLISTNKDIVRVDFQNNVVPVFGGQFINEFLNRDGLVYIGKLLYQFRANDQKIAFDGQLATIQGEKSTDKLLIIQNANSNSKNAKTMWECTYFYTQKEEGGNRRATVSTQTSSAHFWIGTNQNGQDVYLLRWGVRVKGYPEKKNIFGTWVNYHTYNYLKAAFNFKIHHFYIASGYPVSKWVNCNYSNNWNEITYDDSVDFYTIEPQTLQAAQYHSLEHGPTALNEYETGGVSAFFYGCP
ncbi:MAG: hypothetical protein ACK4GN_05100 [Runella sp.]